MMGEEDGTSTPEKFRCGGRRRLTFGIHAQPCITDEDALEDDAHYNVHPFEEDDSGIASPSYLPSQSKSRCALLRAHISVIDDEVDIVTFGASSEKTQYSNDAG